MKYLLLCFVLLLGGCSYHNFYQTNYQLNKAVSARVGDPLILIEAGISLNEIKETHHKTELIYTGINKNIINIVYNEYKKSGLSDGDLIIVPGKTLYLTFDLNNSNTIRIKDYQIEILKAGNDNIEYKVLTEMLLPVEQPLYEDSIYNYSVSRYEMDVILINNDTLKNVKLSQEDAVYYYFSNGEKVKPVLKSKIREIKDIKSNVWNCSQRIIDNN